MDSKEKELLQSLRGPSEALKADAARYMKDFSFRSSVDKADIENSTNLGRTLKSVWYGKPATPDAPPQEVKPQSAVDLARDVKEFPLSRCQAIFKRDANTPGESYRDLTPEQYQSAKRAAKFLGVLPNDGSDASVKYIYSTSRDRAAALQAKEDTARTAEQRQADQLPPGITRDADGGLLLTDSAAFETWKAGKSEHKAAIDYLESQAQ